MNHLLQRDGLTLLGSYVLAVANVTFTPNFALFCPIQYFSWLLTCPLKSRSTVNVISVATFNGR